MRALRQARSAVYRSGIDHVDPAILRLRSPNAALIPVCPAPMITTSAMAPPDLSIRLCVRAAEELQRFLRLQPQVLESPRSRKASAFSESPVSEGLSTVIGTRQ